VRIIRADDGVDDAWLSQVFVDSHDRGSVLALLLLTSNQWREHREVSSQLATASRWQCGEAAS